MYLDKEIHEVFCVFFFLNFKRPHQVESTLMTKVKERMRQGIGVDEDISFI